VLPVGGPEEQDLFVVERTAAGLTITRRGRCKFVPLFGRDANDPNSSLNKIG
jgi:hypothetical protein